jgi:DNA mismatch endonuclease (patch repair protein)
MDRISKELRSSIMSRIRSVNTTPERAVRAILHGLGFRFRLHQKNLPGKPDIVLTRHRKIILVQGCFWHGHTCALASKPKSNTDYWEQKIRLNRTRDRNVRRRLVSQGWHVLELWECDIRKRDGIVDKLTEFMRG